MATLPAPDVSDEGRVLGFDPPRQRRDLLFGRAPERVAEVLKFTAINLSPTNLVYNIVAIPSGVYRYIREGRMNWPVTYVTILGTLPGLYVGAILREGVLRYQANFQFFVCLVLIYIGGRLLYDQTAWAKRKKAKIQEFEAQVQVRLKKVLDEAGHTTGKGLPGAARVRTKSWSLTRVSYEFLGETFSFNVPALFILFPLTLDM